MRPANIYFLKECFVIFISGVNSSVLLKIDTVIKQSLYQLIASIA